MNIGGRANECILTIPFRNAGEAEIVRNALIVDEELAKPELLTRTISLADNLLIVKFTSTELRLLRVAVYSFYDMLIVAVKVLYAFS